METGECYYYSSIVENPHDANNIFTSGYIYDTNTYEYTAVIHESNDAGATWTPINVQGPQADYVTIWGGIDISATDPDIIYAAGEEYDSSIGYLPKMWKSTDGGATWGDATGDLRNLVPAGYPYGIWVWPKDSNRVVVGVYNYGGVTTSSNFVTTDGGTTWTEIPIDNYAYDFAYYPAMDRAYMGTTGSGVWESDDGGLTWTDNSTGLVSNNIYFVEVDPKNGWVFAGANAGGVSRLDVEPSPLWVGGNEVTEASGGSIDLLLNAGAANAGRNYLVLGSVTGTDPGTPLPGGVVSLPLNWDLLTNLIATYANTSLFKDFYGTLDKEGKGAAQFNLGGVPGYAGTVIYFAYCINAPYDYASNPIWVDVVM